MLEYMPGGDLRHYLKRKFDTRKEEGNQSDQFPSGLGESEVQSILQ